MSGETAAPATIEAIHRLPESEPAVERVHEILTMHLGLMAIEDGGSGSTASAYGNPPYRATDHPDLRPFRDVMARARCGLTTGPGRDGTTIVFNEQMTTRCQRVHFRRNVGGACLF